MEKIDEETDNDEGGKATVCGAEAAASKSSPAQQIRQRTMLRRAPIGDVASRLLRSQSACCPEPRLVPLRHSPARARRSHSLPITPSPSIIEKLTMDRMPCSPRASPEDRSLAMPDCLGSPLGSPPSPTPLGPTLERKRSLDFSQLHSLGVIREQDP